MLCIDKRRRAAAFLPFCNNLQRQCCLARGFRSVDLDDAAFRHTADAKRDVEPDRSGRYGLNIPGGMAVSHPHDRAFTNLLFYLAEGLRECFFAIVIHYSGPFSGAREASSKILWICTVLFHEGR